MSGRFIPTSIRRQLRQEAGFGCAQCGNPLIEYHHIIPWSESKVHRPEHMVALCGTCHTSIGKLQRSVAYRLKAAPKNIKDGKIHGLLGTDKAQPSFVLGTNTFIRTPDVFRYFGRTIFKYDVREGQHLISAYLPRDDFWPELRIVENDMTMDTAKFWDVEFRTNYFRVQRKTRETFLEIDLRGEHAKVAADFSIRGQRFIFDDEQSSIGSSSIQNSTMIDCGAGISFGDRGERLMLPNYAQHHSRVGLLREGRSIQWI
ncbi:HNH endonuclease [Pseudooctadecabacter sp.]|uniref:HNH endonuclease n=1 Tax=Pseudooctadecabacter sp. TaxID=1966338 RepID=UPI0025FFDAF0|nr:HNH endonuclease signature motif containing protein [Pseudooctadecabacter sp.]